MAYSVRADVQRLIKWITFSETSKLTNDDIDGMISEADARIDGMIGNIYEVPVTDSSDKKILTFASTRLAAYEAAKVLIVQAGGDLPAVVEGWKSSADNYIAKLVSRTIVLVNTSKRARPETSGLYSYTADDVDAPDRTWELEKDQW